MNQFEKRPDSPSSDDTERNMESEVEGGEISNTLYEMDREATAQGELATAASNGDHKKSSSWCSCNSIIILMFFVYVCVTGAQVVTLFYPSLAWQFVDSANLGPVYTSYWNSATQFDMSVYVSPHKRLNKAMRDGGSSHMIYEGTHLSVEDTFSVEEKVPISASLLKKNQTLYAHVLFSDSSDPSNQYVTSTVSQLTKIVAPFMNRTQRLRESTAGGGADEAADDRKVKQGSPTLVDGQEHEGDAGFKPYSKYPFPHIRRTLNIHIVNDFRDWPREYLPVDMAHSFTIERDSGEYLPFSHVSDDVWAAREKYIPLNETDTSVMVNVTYAPVSLGWFRLSRQVRCLFSCLFTFDQPDEINQRTSFTRITYFLYYVFHLAPPKTPSISSHLTPSPQIHLSLSLPFFFFYRWDWHFP